LRQCSNSLLTRNLCNGFWSLPATTLPSTPPLAVASPPFLLGSHWRAPPPQPVPDTRSPVLRDCRASIQIRETPPTCRRPASSRPRLQLRLRTAFLPRSEPVRSFVSALRPMPSW